MANEQMAQQWAEGGAEWVRNERIFDAAFAPCSAAVLESSAPGAGDRVLDVGCGTGGLLEAVVATGADAVGADISPTMTAAASTRVPAATVLTADAQTDDLLSMAPGRPFDRIVSRFGVMFFDDPVAAFANLRSSAAVGASLAFVCWRAEEVDMFSLGLGPLRERLSSPSPPPAPDEPGPLGLADPDRTRGLLGAAGWSRIEVRAFDAPCDFAVDGGDGVEERLRIALGGNSGRALRAELEPRLGVAGWDEVVEEVRDELRTRVVDGHLVVTGHTWVVTARNPA